MRYQGVQYCKFINQDDHPELIIFKLKIFVNTITIVKCQLSQNTKNNDIVEVAFITLEVIG